MTLQRRLGLVFLAAASLSLAACKPEQGDSTAGGASSPGKVIFDQQCSICHGRFGKGDTMISTNYAFADLTDGRWGYGASREDHIRNVTEGIPRTPMRGFKGVLTDQEIASVVDYVLTLPSQAK